MKKEKQRIPIYVEIDNLFLWAINKVPKVEGQFKGKNAKKWDERHQALRILKMLKPRIKFLLKNYENIANNLLE